MSESLKTIDPTPQAVMLALAFSYFLPCALHVAAELGIADHFADARSELMNWQRPQRPIHPRFIACYACLPGMASSLRIHQATSN